MPKRGMPAVAAIKITSLRIILAEDHGTCVAGTDNPATLNDFFHIGSCAKSLLAAPGW
jgi:hypothetical protein